ncbi:MAG: nucleotidyltransferase [Firmicutes bacterium]|nr:nucleotidyltransferase [Bacillota bacterium]
MDIDFLLRDTPNSQENIMTMIGDISDTVTENDIVRFEIKGLVPIAEEREYNGIRVKMIAYIKQTRTPFELDTGVGDVVIPKAEPRKLLTQLDGFSEPEVLTYSLESTIAEKFDAIIARMELSSRMKDYYDIYFLATTFHFEARKLQVAILATLQKRKTIYGEDAVERVHAFEQSDDMRQKWKRFTTATIKIPLEFGDVVEIIDKFIGPVFRGIVSGQEVSGVWNPATVRYE